jgi:hypothetical protein
VRAADARTCCVRVRTCVRVRLGARASAPKHASAFRRRGPRVARLAGVLPGVGVQREHRRVEHRRGHHVVRGMRRLSGPGGTPPQAGCAWRGRRCGAGRPRMLFGACRLLHVGCCTVSSARFTRGRRMHAHTTMGCHYRLPHTGGLLGGGGSPEGRSGVSQEYAAHSRARART